MSRLRRFLHIERSRAERPEGDRDAAPETADRFAGVERPARRQAPSAGSGAELGRFGPEPPPEIELVETAAGERPFTRCARCGMDHHVFATECTQCGASLDTAAQRDFNERLWARRQEEVARDERAEAERRAMQARAEAELAAARRAMGEEIAREVGRRERLRLDTEARRDGLGGARAAPLGQLLVRLWDLLARLGRR
jgi:hypothetical protein